MLAQNVVARGCSLASQLALAALLSPAEFGIIGLAYTVTNLASAIINVGIDDVALQRHRALRFWTGPVFWISLGLATVAAALVLLVSPLAGAVYGSPSLVGLLAVIALSMPIGALATVPGMVMRARMQFGAVALYNTLEVAVQAALTVAFAWAGFGAYSFVIPAPILAVAKAVIWWRLAGGNVSLRPRLRRWKYVVGSTAALFVSRIATTLMGQGDYMILGLLASQEIVGGYYFGFRLAAQPLWMLAGNFAGVLYPALVRLKSEPVRQREAALNASTLLSFCVMPVALLQAAAAAPLVGGIFGQKWTASIPVIQLLSVGLAFDAVSWLAGTMLAARGEFRALSRYLLAQTPVFFAMVLCGALLDKAVGVAWAVCLFYVTVQPIFVRTAYRRIGVSLTEIALIYVRPTLYAAASAGLGLAVSLLPLFDHAPLVRVLVIGMIGPATYAVLVRHFAPGVWEQLVRRLKGVVRRTAG